MKSDALALVYIAHGRMAVQRQQKPVASNGETLVQVMVSGICGSEIHGVRSRDPMRVPPLIMGHEFAGVCLGNGKRVAVNPLISCRACARCRAGRENLCPERRLIGVHRPGGFAQLVAVPADALYALPAGMSWETAALIEPLANAVHGWRLLCASPGSRVAIVGAGAIGLMTLVVARNRRPDAHVTVVDLDARRLAVAQSLGAACTSTKLEGTFDLVIDAVGSRATRRAGLEALRPGGAALWFGLHDDHPGFDALRFVRHEQQLLGSFAYTRDDFCAAIDLATATDPSWLTMVGIADAATTFHELVDGVSSVVKAVIDFTTAPPFDRSQGARGKI